MTSSINSVSTTQSTSSSSSTSSNLTSSTSSTTSSTSSDLSSTLSNEAVFLKLLVTQLQNQDPLSPTDTSQFTQQLVEYAQVEQQIKTNTKLDTLVSQGNTTQTAAALSFIGMEVQVSGDTTNYDGSTPLEFAYTLSSAASSITATITDSSGSTVDTLTLSTTSGSHTVTWDGTSSSGSSVSSGAYTVSISATNASGSSMDVSESVYGKVTAIESQNSTTSLLLGDVSVDLSNVIGAAPASSTA
ncbi:MAG: FlgD immunoglobulin-like domain containing protein [Azospirillaceae bacterium]|nr:FlgD immunoglobulin-like domain containing protein [Azospirillaceae bacterium]